MRILLNSSQLQAVSDFSLDVAKGLMLAGILGQGFTSIESIQFRIFGSILIVVMSFMFLYFGVQFRKKLRK